MRGISNSGQQQATMKEQAKNKVNRSDLASVFGIAPTTVDAWIKAGCPYLERPTGRGKGWVFDTAAVARWREQRAAEDAAGKEVQDEAALRLRKLAAEAKSAEMELLQRMGALAPIDEMEREWSRVLAEVQSNLRGSLITRLATQLIGETDARAFKRIALAEVDSVLESLANMDLSEEAEPDDSDTTTH